MRPTTSIAAALLLAGCQGSVSRDEDAAQQAPSNFAPPVADAAPAPVRVIDGSVLHDLAKGKIAGVYLIDLRRVPEAMRPQVAAERAEDAACRQGDANGDAPRACRRRDQMIAELKRKGWCWGPDAEVEADRRWMRQGTGCHG